MKTKTNLLIPIVIKNNFIFMAKNYIIFGNCTKNYFLPLFLALTLIILIIINRFVETDDYKIYNELFEEYAIAAGELSVKKQRNVYIIYY